MEIKLRALVVEVVVSCAEEVGLVAISPSTVFKAARAVVVSLLGTGGSEEVKVAPFESPVSAVPMEEGGGRAASNEVRA